MLHCWRPLLPIGTVWSLTHWREKGEKSILDLSVSFSCDSRAIKLTVSVYFLLETKLNQLEGKDRQLTSKDIVSALSEARDDHLKDHVTPRDSTTSYVNEFADLDEIQTEEKTVGCCGLCARHYPRRRGWGRRKLSDSDRHEYACLIDCDELELSVSSESATSSDRNERRNEHTNYGEQHSHQD